MKNKGFFNKLFNKCDTCGYLFGRHDMFEHMIKGMMKSIEKIGNNPESIIDIHNQSMNKFADGMKNTQGPIAIPNVIKIQADVEFSKANAVKVYSSHPDFWTDFGFWVQAFGFMTYRAMKYQEWSQDKMLKHVSAELGKCIEAHILKK